jgi:hypothetical protein
MGEDKFQSIVSKNWRKKAIDKIEQVCYNIDVREGYIWLKTIASLV